MTKKDSSLETAISTKFSLSSKELARPAKKKGRGRGRGRAKGGTNKNAGGRGEYE